jgi:hypothetical protein
MVEHFKKMNSIQISRVLHAGYIFESQDAKIIFDPIFENPFSHNCYAFPNVKFDHEKIQKTQFSAVFISHYHDDHCSFESLIHIHRDIPIYIFCIFEEMISMIKELGFKNVYSLQIGQHVCIKDFRITVYRALDADVDSIFQIKVQGLNILNVVDSWIDQETMDLLFNESPWDLILWPFQMLREIEVIAPTWSQAQQSIQLPHEWIQQIQKLNPKNIVPSSCQFIHENWSWYNQALFPISYSQFENEIAEILPKTKVIRLDPGTSIEMNINSIRFKNHLDWVIPVGPQNIDYEYNSKLVPPQTSEISKKFEQLSSEQINAVFDYCQVGLIQKYNSLDPSFENYFNQDIHWKLSIYDHKGAVTNFFFQIKESKISKTEYTNQAINWLTEIPISKFFAALNRGESLTSMYMRINDCSYGPQLDHLISSVDILEDPLIRCLFSRKFGSYQLAQLKRIHNN